MDPSRFLIAREPDHQFDRLDRYEREEDELREVYRARHLIPNTGHPAGQFREVSRNAAILVLLIVGAAALMQLAGQS